MGNVDNDSTKTNLFDPPIIGQYFRIIPVVCRKACTLRMELVGCELNGKHTHTYACLLTHRHARTHTDNNVNKLNGFAFQCVSDGYIIQKVFGLGLTETVFQ